LPYIDVKGLRELPLTLLGRHPDRMSKDIIDKIGADQDLFRVRSDPHIVDESLQFSESFVRKLTLLCNRTPLDCTQRSSAQDLAFQLEQIQRGCYPYCNGVQERPRRDSNGQGNEYRSTHQGHLTAVWIPSSPQGHPGYCLNVADSQPPY